MNSSKQTPTVAPADEQQKLGLLRVDSLDKSSSHEFEDPREIRTQLLREYVGGKNQSYYMALFHRFEQHTHLPLPSFNMAAFAFGIFWLGYRKMVLFSILVYPCLYSLFAYSSYLLLAENYTSTDSWLFNPSIDLSIIIALLLSSVTLGFWGNYCYYLHSLIRVKQAQRKYASILQQRKHLAKSGMVSRKLPFLVLMLSPIVLLPASLYLEQYLNSANRQISMAVNALEQASDSVSAYRLVHGEWPGDESMIKDSIDSVPREFIRDISLNSQLLVLTFQSKHPVMNEFRGKSLAYFGRLNNRTGRVVWSCGSINLQLVHLPGYCKQHF